MNTSTFTERTLYLSFPLIIGLPCTSFNGQRWPLYCWVQYSLPFSESWNNPLISQDTINCNNHGSGFSLHCHSGKFGSMFLADIPSDCLLQYLLDLGLTWVEFLTARSQHMCPKSFWMAGWWWRQRICLQTRLWSQALVPPKEFWLCKHQLCPNLVQGCTGWGTAAQEIFVAPYVC